MRFFPLLAWTLSLAAFPAAVHAGGGAGTIIVKCRPDATITIGGQKMTQTGPLRTFHTPELTPGRYQYEFTVTWMEKGASKKTVKWVEVSPGKTTNVDLVIPDDPYINVFTGKLDGWKLKGDAKKSKWKVGVAGYDEKPGKLLLISSEPGSKLPELINDTGPGGIDIYSEQKFGDATILVELMVPKGSNSGIYVMGEYEVQILDSFGRDKVGPGDMGGLYGASAPRVNACKKPGEWQEFIIDFKAPRFEGGKKTSNAKFLKISLNGTVIHENVEMKGPTPSGVSGKEAPTGPIMFQGDHGPVAFRNVRVIARNYDGK